MAVSHRKGPHLDFPATGMRRFSNAFGRALPHNMVATVYVALKIGIEPMVEAGIIAPPPIQPASLPGATGSQHRPLLLQ